jgi:hypothetical protein
MSKLQAKVEAALKIDPGIVSGVETVQFHPGRTEEQLAVLGLERKDLKRLEKHGLAVRGYEQTKEGLRVKWLLYVPGGANGK